MNRHTIRFNRALQEKIDYLLRNTQADSIDTLLEELIDREFKKVKAKRG